MTDLELMNGALLGISAGAVCGILFDLLERRFGGTGWWRWRTLHAAGGVGILGLVAWRGWRGTATPAGLLTLTLTGTIVLATCALRLRAARVPVARDGGLGRGASGLGGLASLGTAVAGMLIGQRWSWELGGVIAALGLGAFVWTIVADGSIPGT